MSPKVYLAGSWKQKDIMHAAHVYARQRGLNVVSTWTEQEEREYTSEELLHCALSDWAQLLDADVLVYLDMGVKSEGKATELGAALALRKRTILVGGRSGNIFLNLPAVEQFPSFGAVVNTLLAP